VGQIDKLILKLKNNPKNFKYSELCKVMSHFGYAEDNAGKTSGSVVSFIGHDRSVTIHKPHPSDELPPWVIKKVARFLKEGGNI
jgi:hypothetical protein